MLQITSEQVEFKELAVGDYCFHKNIFYEKFSSRTGKIVSAIQDVPIGFEQTFTGNCLVNIVLNKE